MGKSKRAVQDLRLEVLRALQSDCDRTNKDLAGVLNVDTSTLSRIRQQLKDSGDIKSYKAILDADRSGFTTLAFIKVALAKRDPDKRSGFIRALIRNANVQEIYDIHGAYNLFIKVRFRCNEELHDFTNRVLSDPAEVKAYNVTIAMKVCKEQTDLPV